MMNERFGASRQDVLRLFEGDSVAGLSDGELVDRFANRRDELAFEGLVTRLGPMVLGVCRRMLADPHDVDDAFQATFLVLVKKAGSLRNPDLVAPWLHGVATRVARRARAESARRTIRERVAVVDEGRMEAVGLESEWPELRALIDEEIERLPENHRRAVVLCDVEGLSREEAALRLGWSLNMVRGRLERARDRLRVRLARRGLAPSGAWAALVVARPTPPAALLAATTRAGLAFSAGRMGAGLVSASAVALSRGVLRMMMLSKLKVGLAILVSSGFVAAGSGIIVAQATGDKPAPKAVDVSKEESARQYVAALGKSRVEMARKRWATQQAFYNEGRITIDRLVNASESLLDAELDASDKPEARIGLIQAHLARIKGIEKSEQDMLADLRGTQSDVDEIQTRRLEVEYRLAKEAEAAVRKPTTVPPPADAKPSPKTVDVSKEESARQYIAALGKSRVEMARKRWATQLATYNEGRITIDRLVSASQALLDAELDASDKPEARIGLIQAHLARIKEIEKNDQDLLANTGRTSDVDEIQTQRLEVEYRLAKEAEAASRKRSTAPPPTAARPADLAFARLANERVMGARMLLAEAQRLFPTEIGVADLLDTSEGVMIVERDAATTTAGRLAAIQAHIDRIRGMKPTVDGLIKQGELKRGDGRRVAASLLDAEFALAKENAGPDPQSVADLERRVSEMERKLDRILNLLDAPKR
jgi:RNA polymerase sigma factor (sigma-70 family)